MTSHTDYIQYKIRDVADSIAKKLPSTEFGQVTTDLLQLVSTEMRTISAIIQLVDYLLLNEIDEQKFIIEVKKLLNLGKNISTNELQNEIRDLHWMARRYVDGRATYAVSLFNSITRTLIREGILLESTSKDPLFAKDLHGPTYE